MTPYFGFFLVNAGLLLLATGALALRSVLIYRGAVSTDADALQCKRIMTWAFLAYLALGFGYTLFVYGGARAAVVVLLLTCVFGAAIVAGNFAQNSKLAKMKGILQGTAALRVILFGVLTLEVLLAILLYVLSIG